jgi:hypothetical protein
MCRYVFVRITEDNALTYTNPPCSLECWEEIQGSRDAIARESLA